MPEFLTMLDTALSSELPFELTLTLELAAATYTCWMRKPGNRNASRLAKVHTTPMTNYYDCMMITLVNLRFWLDWVELKVVILDTIQFQRVIAQNSSKRERWSRKSLFARNGPDHSYDYRSVEWLQLLDNELNVTCSVSCILESDVTTTFWKSPVH